MHVNHGPLSAKHCHEFPGGPWVRRVDCDRCREEGRLLQQPEGSNERDGTYSNEQ